MGLWPSQTGRQGSAVFIYTSLELSAAPGPRFAISEGSLIKLIFRDETCISRDDAVTAEVLLDLTAVNRGGRRSWAEILRQDAVPPVQLANCAAWSGQGSETEQGVDWGPSFRGHTKPRILHSRAPTL